MTPHPDNPPEETNSELGPPRPLDYRDASRDRSVKRTRVWHGLLAGFALSVFWWFGGVNNYFHQRQGLGAFGGMVVLAALKLLVSVVAICFPSWRRFGIGLLLSMGLVALIFVGTCFAILAWH